MRKQTLCMRREALRVCLGSLVSGIVPHPAPDCGLPATSPSAEHSPPASIVLSGAVRGDLGVVLSSSPCLRYSNHSLDFFLSPLDWPPGLRCYEKWAFQPPSCL